MHGVQCMHACVPAAAILAQAILAQAFLAQVDYELLFVEMSCAVYVADRLCCAVVVVTTHGGRYYT